MTDPSTFPKKWRRALVFASCDPFTRGHEALVRAAAQVADEVVLSVMTDPSRTYALSDKQRTDLAVQCLLDAQVTAKVTRPPDAAGQRVVHELVRNRCDVVVRAARPGEEHVELARMRVEVAGFPWLQDRWDLRTDLSFSPRPWTPESGAAQLVSGSAVRAAVAAGGWVSPLACSRRSQIVLRSAIRRERRLGLLGTREEFEAVVTACARQAALAGRTSVRAVGWESVWAACGSPPPEGMSGGDLLLLGAYSYEWGRGVNLVWLDERCVNQGGLDVALALGGWEVFVLPSFTGSVAEALVGCGENLEVVKVGDEKRVLARVASLS